MIFSLTKSNWKSKGWDCFINIWLRFAYWGLFIPACGRQV